MAASHLDIQRYSSGVHDIDSLLADLTPPQRQAAMHVNGPLLIVAGAGSGKTRVITRRVAYLMSQHVAPWSILAITFTNKAAGEMKARVASVIDRPLRDFGRLDQPWPLICTFHSLCLRILKHYGTRVGLPQNFSIFDSSDQTKLIKEALKMLDLSSDNFSPPTVHAAISNAKNQLVGPETYAQNAGDFYKRNVARVYTKYQQLLNQNNALDFDDLLLRTVVAFRDHPDVLGELQERFQYLLIDEYQDTNHVQYVLAHAMAMRHRNICVVGDPDQSIYAWRGADLRNILDFEKDYPDATIVRLEQNYRSTKRILRLASTLIANNVERKDKTLWTENDEGEKAVFFTCQDERDEATMVTEKLRALNAAGTPWSEMAIFYRMNSLSRVMEDGLRKAGVPYQIARGVEFYNRKEIKDAMAYLRVVANPNDQLSLERIANVPARGLSDASLKQMGNYAATRGLSLWQGLEGAAEVPGLTSRAINSARMFVEQVGKWRTMVYGSANAENPVAESSGSTASSNAAASADMSSQRTQRSLAESDVEPSEVASDSHMPDLFSSLTPPPEVDKAFDPFGASDMSAMSDDEIDSAGSFDDAEGFTTLPTPSAAMTNPNVSRGHVKDIVEAVIRQSGLEAYLRKTGGEELDELHNVEELISSAAEFDKENPQGTLDDFLAQISLVSDADHMDGAGGAVTLMTLHAAKGLEFPVVAIIGLEEGILPHSRARGNLHELEEERRLFFVGITRAEQQLIISRAARRTLRGLTEVTITSPFLRELPQADLEAIDRTGVPTLSKSGKWKDGDDSSQFDATSHDGGQFAHMRRGQLVRHSMFGVGRILTIESLGDNRTRATVQFTRVGEKKLFLDIAKLETLD